jgi:tRNA pseudouridine55 synthase
MIHGVLVVDKEEGSTSRRAGVLAARLLGVGKFGHLGTLDPLATGVLPICLGKATRLARFLSGGRKVYEGAFLLGVTTDSHDRAGQVLERRPVPASLAGGRLAEALAQLEGPLEQIPPMHSARKVGGVRLYRLARKGLEVNRAPRGVTVHRLEASGLEGERVRFRLECSAGTYVRALARDLGEILGCGAILESLRRTRAEPFALDQAVPQADLRGVEGREAALGALIPLERLDLRLPKISLGPAALQLLLHGGAVPLPPEGIAGTPPWAEGDAVCVHGPQGELAAVARAAGGERAVLQPLVVLAAEEDGPPAGARRRGAAGTERGDDPPGG